MNAGIKTLCLTTWQNGYVQFFYWEVLGYTSALHYVVCNDQPIKALSFFVRRSAYSHISWLRSSNLQPKGVEPLRNNPCELKSHAFANFATVAFCEPAFSPLEHLNSHLPPEKELLNWGSYHTSKRSF